MPSNNETTTKFKADISQLKSAMQEASRSIRLANSEFKAATAGMNNWAKSTDGLSAKITQLNKVMNAQKSQLTSLEKQYALVAKEQGADSKGAQELMIKINNQRAAIGKTESQLESYESELKDAEKGNKKLGDSTAEAGRKAESSSEGFTVLKGALANLVASGVKTAISGLRKLGSTAISVGKEAVESYAQYEQLVGGVETLFGSGGKSLKEYAKSVGKTTDEVKTEYNKLMKAQSAVLKNADQAYKNAGLSANEYMETVTSFSASLLQGLGGDTVKAASLADKAVIDMSDNANKMGTSMESIQNAYQGFAKQNFSMLDNLKLGYGGTQKEMFRLMQDAAKLDDTFAKNANFSIDSKGHLEAEFTDIINAIHIVQDSMGITGTTSDEAATTIEGSVNSVKSAWSNLIRGLADDNANFDTLIKNFTDGASTAFQNLLPRIKSVISGIGNLVGSLIQNFAPVIAKELPGILTDLSNTILKVLPQTLQTLGTGILTAVQTLAPTVLNIVTQIINMFIKGLPKFFQLGTDIINQLVQGIIQNLPEIVANITSFMTNDLPGIITSLIQTIVSVLQNGIPAVISGALELLKGIKRAIPVIAKELSSELPSIINTIVQTLTESIDLIIQGAIDLFNGMIDAMPTVIDSLVEALPVIINAIIGFFDQNIDKIIDGAINLFMALVDAIPKVLPSILKAIPKIIISVVQGILKLKKTLFKAGISLFLKLAEAVPKVWVKLKNAVSDLLSKLWSALKEAPSKVAAIGKNLIEGLWNGIKDMAVWIRDKITGFGESVLNTLKDFFGIASPSKLMKDEVGRWIAKGIVSGILAEEKNTIRAVKSNAKKITAAYGSTFVSSIRMESNTLTSVAKGMVSKTLTTMMDAVRNHDFSGVAGIAGSNFSEALTQKSDYIMNKIEYQQTSRLNAWDKKIEQREKKIQKAASKTEKAGEKKQKEAEKYFNKEIAKITKEGNAKKALLEKKRDKAEQSREKNNTVRLEKLEKERDKKIKKLEKKREKIDKDPYYGSTKNEDKKKLSKRIASVKKEYTERIKAEKTASKSQDTASKNRINKQIEAIEKETNKRIKAQNKGKAKEIKLIKKTSKDEVDAIKKRGQQAIDKETEQRNAFEEASAKFLDSFGDALNDYQKQAEDLINSVINGISDKYQKKYDDLISKQDELVSKLQSAGDLFDISGAGVISINDITVQTDNIKKYAEKLKAVKDKVAPELFDEIAKADMKEGSKYMDYLLGLSDEELKSYSSAYVEKMNTAREIAEGMYKSDIDEVSKDYEKEIKAAFEGLPKEMEGLGEQAFAGFVGGLQGDTDYLKGAVKKTIDELIAQYKSQLGIASPSKVLMRIGEFTGEGFAEGLKETINSVKSAASSLIDITSGSLNGIKSDIGTVKTNAMGGNTSSISNVTNNYNLVQNNNSPKSLSALETYQARRQQISMIKALTTV